MGRFLSPVNKVHDSLKNKFYWVHHASDDAEERQSSSQKPGRIKSAKCSRRSQSPPAFFQESSQKASASRLMIKIHRVIWTVLRKYAKWTWKNFFQIFSKRREILLQLRNHRTIIVKNSIVSFDASLQLLCFVFALEQFEEQMNPLTTKWTEWIWLSQTVSESYDALSTKWVPTCWRTSWTFGSQRQIEQILVVEMPLLSFSSSFSNPNFTDQLKS